jgi:hypothetical protein
MVGLSTVSNRAIRQRRGSATGQGFVGNHATRDRHGHLYQAARDRLRDHLDEAYVVRAVEASGSAV